MSLSKQIEEREIRNAKKHLLNLIEVQNLLREQLANKDREVEKARRELEQLEKMPQGAN